MKFVDIASTPRRIVGVAADVDDENVVPGPALTVYHPMAQEELGGGRLFVHTRANPYTLVQPVTRLLREMSAEQVVEKAATLEDVRAEVLTPDRLNALVFGVFAGVALIIAVVGVAGVLAFSVSGRTREFGIRMAIGSQPGEVLRIVIAEGAWMAVAGIVAGAACGFALAQLAGSYFPDLKMPGVVPVAGSAIILLTAAVVASVLPAARAARVDVMQALRSD
jgi:putative ABC transport system permease protein